MIAEIIDKSSQYQFLQLMRMLEAYQIFEQSEFMTAKSLGFPATDLSSIKQNSRDLLLQIEINFMGLFGVDAPLPHYFLREAHQDSKESQCFQAFLNIFNHRIYQLSYFAWKKYQPIILLESQNNDYLKYLIALSGNKLTEDDTQSFAAAGLFGRRVRSKIGLEAILRDYLNGLTATIVQFVPAWRECQCLAVLGKTLSLSNNIILGTRVLTLADNILIDIGPMPLDRALLLETDLSEKRELFDLIRRYIDPMLSFKVRLLIYPANLKKLRLRADDILLGWKSWIGEFPSRLCVLNLCE